MRVGIEKLVPRDDKDMFTLNLTFQSDEEVEVFYSIFNCLHNTNPVEKYCGNKFHSDIRKALCEFKEYKMDNDGLSNTFSALQDARRG